MYLAAHFFMIFGALFVFAIVLIGILALGVILLTIGLISRHLNKKKGLRKKYPKVCIIIGGIFMAISLGTFGIFAIDFLDDSGSEYNSATYDPHESTWAQDEKYCEDVIMEVVRCLDEDDTEGLKSMFSAYAMELSDLDSQIEEAMKIYEGQSVERNDITYSLSGRHIGDGYYSYKGGRVRMYNIITGADIEYYIDVVIVLVDDEEPEKEGIEQIIIHDRKNHNEILIEIGKLYG